MSPIPPPSEPLPMANASKPAIRLLFATIERCPTYRPDVATLFGKFLPRFGVSSDLVAERAPDVAGEVSWGGGEALLISSRGSRPRRYAGNLAHYALTLLRADRAKYQAIQEDLVGKGIARQKLTPVVMGVDLEASLPEAIAPADDARLKGKRVLIYLGTLARGRRIEVLFDMLKILRQRFPDVLLLLVGEADDEVDEKRLRKLADDAGVAEATVWTGWLPPREAWRYVRAAEVGLAPVPRGSMLDCGSPTKVLEYLALGVPVVANDNPDQERVLREGGGGLCVPLTAHDFAQAVSRLLVDEPLRRAMASSGQSYVRASRGYQTLAKLVADKYAELLHAQ